MTIRTSNQDEPPCNFYEVVKGRRTVREFQSKPVEEEKLLRILAAGLRAPSHNHLREWEFILIKDPDSRRKLVELGAKARDVTGSKELAKMTEQMTDDLQGQMYVKANPVQKSMLMGAPELLVVCFRMRKALKQCKTLYDLNSFASIWTCVENILLAMAAEDLYGVTYIPNKTEPIKKVLGIPHDYEVAALIPIGYPKDYAVRQKAVSLKEKLHLNKW